MKSELEAAGLIALLFVVTFALGIEFGGSGLAAALGGFGPPGSPQPKAAATPPPPLFVLRAEGINPKDLYSSAFYKAIPAEMMVPLVGLHAMLVSAGRGLPTHFERTPSILMMTNASGIASGYLPQGDYEVDISGSNFAVSTAITLSDNTTSTLSLTLSPSARDVSTMKVVSQDSVIGLEPTSKLYALLNYTSAPSDGFSELVGFEPVDSATPASGIVFYVNSTVFGGAQVSLNATILGSYPGTQGYWATLSPSGSYPAYPSVSVILFQYTPIVEVNYTAG